MIEQIIIFEKGGKIFDVSQYTLTNLIDRLNIDILPDDLKSLINNLLDEQYASNLTINDNRVLKLYFNLILKYDNIKNKSEIIDIIATRNYYQNTNTELAEILDKYLESKENNMEKFFANETELMIYKELIPNIVLNEMLGISNSEEYIEPTDDISVEELNEMLNAAEISFELVDEQDKKELEDYILALKTQIELLN